MTSRNGFVYRGGDREGATRCYRVAVRDAAETGEVSAVLMVDSVVIERWERSTAKSVRLDFLPEWIERLVIRAGKRLHFFGMEEDKG
ncbi:MAG TPA: hypothetical protein VEL74_12860 [Thermoanaerobaculia bacterium]|nr:hypothetical protein [Thermoanaerobaculia bacterium]